MNASGDPTTGPGPDATPQGTPDAGRASGATSDAPTPGDARESDLFAPIPAPRAGWPAWPDSAPGAADVRWNPRVGDPESELGARGGLVGRPRPAARRPLVAGMAAAAGLVLALGGAFGIGHAVGRSGSDGVETSQAGVGTNGVQASTSPDLLSSPAPAVDQVAALPVSDDESS